MAPQSIVCRSPLQRFPASSSSSKFKLLKNQLVTLGLLLLLQLTATEAAIHSVSTYKNGSTLFGQRLTSSTLNWVTYDAKDPKQLEFAVEGGKYITDDEHYSIYVCRVTIDGVPTSGHTEKVMQAHVCVAAHHKHAHYSNFDVLINQGHLGKVVWKAWTKFNAGVPIGAIAITDDAYIARHRVPKQQQHQSTVDEPVEQRGADYNLGRFDPVGLGKIKVVENERDKDYEDGDVLVELEPLRYELRHINLDKIRLDMIENITDLASAVLVNRGDKYSVVEMVLSYHFDYVQYWGTHDGVARGLPTKIYEKDSSTPTEINWSLKNNETRFETKSVGTQLHPGTALNVTLKGNYVTLEAPYKAKLFVFYSASEDSVSRTISSEVRKSYLKDVKLEFSPVYWIENGTFVPTTTTSTTSTTTNPTTTSTGEPKPMHEPPVVHMKDVGQTHSGPDSLEKSLHDAPSSNEVTNEVPENLAEKHQTKASAAGVPGSGTANGSRALAVGDAGTTAAILLLLATLATGNFITRNI